LPCKESELIALLEIIEEEVFENTKTLDEAIQKWKKLKAHIKEIGLQGVRRELMI